MNVFVLCTGRCGSVTFTRACEKLTNFTAAHESRFRLNGADRLTYPANHIETDNRLAWFLGSLEKQYGDNAYYVHLKRDPEEVAQSYARRWEHPQSIIRAFGIGIVPARQPDPILMARDMVSTITDNIEMFLADKSNVKEVRLAHVKDDFASFLSWIAAEGDLAKAIDEWDVVHNPTKASSPTLS